MMTLPRLNTALLLLPLGLLLSCSSQPSIGGEDNDDDKPSEFGDDDIFNADAGSVNAPDQGEDDEFIPSEPEADVETCGNSRLDDGESCDDGNSKGGDGCSKKCILEEGFTCPSMGVACERAKVCGDGLQTGDEECDDANLDDGDGCTATCLLEADFACPSPGEACLSTVDCGDGRVSGDETCDDGNTEEDDGCDQTCTVQAGWECAIPGARCTPICGDALVTGRETCDDGNTDKGDGCNHKCRLESGYTCDAPGEACRETVCGDGKAEGDEPCDDGEDIHVGDGCSPGCKLEPVCQPATAIDGSEEPAVDAGADGPRSAVAVSGTCSSTCGDGLILAGDDEDCDDGNNVAGDGCDEDCQVEEGWTCALVSTELPDELVLPVVYRDFVHVPAADGSTPRHPDFQTFSGGDPTRGLVEPILGADGKPAYTGLCEAGMTLDGALCPYNAQTTSEENFDQWYRDTPDVNIAVMDALSFTRQADDTYVFGGGGGLFPLDDLGWTATDPVQEAESSGHNFGFTTELRYWFEFKGGEFLEFQGDDDVWVFIGGQLVVDIGGLHPSRTASVTLDEPTSEALGLQVGRIYEIVLFHAERHTGESNFKLTIGGFVSAETQCKTDCGDGVIAGDESCDDGPENGSGYGYCTKDCQPGPRCGDGKLNGKEECDDGVNLSGHQGADDGSSCAPGCVLPPRCGDGRLDTNFGEKCDDGDNNTGEYDGCNPDCTLGPRCGDGSINGEDELCDDGNLSNGDSCDVTCKPINVVVK